MTAEFGFLTFRQPQDTLTTTKVFGANENSQQNGENSKTSGVDLKTTDIFTANKKGVQPNAQKNNNNLLAGGNSGFGGVNAFGDDSGFGDTVSFSTKANNDNASNQTSAYGSSKSSGLRFANNDSELKELADELGCEANEDTVKNKLNSMNPKELAKLDGSALDIADELGFISENDINKKLGLDNKNDGQEQDQSRKIAFGTFTSGSEV